MPFSGDIFVNRYQLRGKPWAVPLSFDPSTWRVVVTFKLRRLVQYPLSCTRCDWGTVREGQRWQPWGCGWPDFWWWSSACWFYSICTYSSPLLYVYTSRSYCALFSLFINYNLQFGNILFRLISFIFWVRGISKEYKESNLPTYIIHV